MANDGRKPLININLSIRSSIRGISYPFFLVILFKARLQSMHVLKGSSFFLTNRTYLCSKRGRKRGFDRIFIKSVPQKSNSFYFFILKNRFFGLDHFFYFLSLFFVLFFLFCFLFLLQKLLQKRFEFNFRLKKVVQTIAFSLFCLNS